MSPSSRQLHLALVNNPGWRITLKRKGCAVEVTGDDHNTDTDSSRAIQWRCAAAVQWRDPAEPRLEAGADQRRAADRSVPTHGARVGVRYLRARANYLPVREGVRSGV